MKVIIVNNLFTRFEGNLLTLQLKQNVVKKKYRRIFFNSNKTKRLFSHYDFVSDDGRSLEIVLLIGYTFQYNIIHMFVVYAVYSKCFCLISNVTYTTHLHIIIYSCT